MKNITALDFATLHPSFGLYDTLPRSQVAGKLREIAELIDSGMLVIQSASSLDTMHEGQLAHTSVLFNFRRNAKAERSPLQKELDERRLTGKRESPERDKQNRESR